MMTTNLPDFVEVNGVRYEVIVYDPMEYPTCPPLRDGEVFIGRQFARPGRAERGVIYMPQTIEPSKRRAELDATVESIAAHDARCGKARVA